MQASDHLEPAIFVIFGGEGDLSWRKLVPAIYDLYRNQMLPEQFKILSVDRVDFDDARLRKHYQEGVKKFSRHGKMKEDEWKVFAEHIHYLRGDFNKNKTYKSLSLQLKKIDKEGKVEFNKIFYMATSPSFFGIISKHLKEAGLASDKLRSRLIVEKPIGYDLESARQLNNLLKENFDECQIFRIDHYLGKETVQNILALRFANPIFEPLWNRQYINYITITVAETVGVEHRGGYYEHAGALRDMVQNHLLQLFCLIAMEPMLSFEPNEIRNKKIDVLHAVRPIDPNLIQQSVVRGQYSSGTINGKPVFGYRDEKGVSRDSFTETFVALKLLIDNWRWQDVPFYLRTGKRLLRHASEICIHFRPIPHQAFPEEATLGWQPARLIIAIQPNEGIILRFHAKYPGPKMNLRNVDMRFSYKETFDVVSPEAYQTLLWDIMKNDLTLFMRADQIESRWQILQPVLDMWSSSPPSDFPNYQAGHGGLRLSNELIALDGHSWPLPVEL